MLSESEKNINYAKPIGAYRPNFQGKPENYYTLSNFDVFCALFSCFGIIIMAFGISIGLFFWSHRVSTSNLITVWSIILIVFIAFFMITAFCYSRGKAEVEEELIRVALDKQIHKKSVRIGQLGVQKGGEYQLQERDPMTYTALQK